MKYIKLFEYFMQTDHTILRKYLVQIVLNYIAECNGENIHCAEFFDDGYCLLNITENKRIDSILRNIADICKAEIDGSNESMCEYMNDDDCNYIADFLKLPHLTIDGIDYDNNPDYDLWEDELRSDLGSGGL